MALDFSIFGGGTTGSVATTTSTTTFGLFGTSSLTPLGGLSSGNALGTTGGGIFGGTTTTGTTTTTTAPSNTTTFGLFGPSTGVLSGGFGFGSTLGGSGGLFPAPPVVAPAPIQVGPQGIDIADQLLESVGCYEFSTSDFMVESGENVSEIQIVTLPANGTLTVEISGTSVNAAAGMKIDEDDFSTLKYTPDSGFDGKDSFSIAMSTDGVLFDSTPSEVCITVLDNVESAPSIDATADIAVEEGQSASGVGSTIVGSFNDPDSTDTLDEVTLTDVPDADEGTLTYTADNGGSMVAGDGAVLSAAEAATLSFNAASDAVTSNGGTVTATIDYTMTGSDGASASGGELDIVISDGNDAPNFTSTPSLPIPVAENATDALGGSYAATDPEGDSITYSLAGADAAKFSINPTTGLISPIAPGLDYETQDADGSGSIANPQELLHITRIATDSNGNAAEQELTVEVTDLDYEAAPVFTSSATHTVAEGDAFSFTVTTTDADAGDTVTYSGVSADTGLSVSSSGVVSLTVQDYEDPKDADADNAYEIEIKATDLGGNTATQTLTVSVTDENDGAPVAGDVDPASVDEGETIAIGDDIIDAYSDPDGDDLATVTITAPASADGTLTYLEYGLLTQTVAAGATVDLDPDEAETLKFTAANGLTADKAIVLSFDFEDSTNMATTASGSMPIVLFEGNDAPTVSPASVTLNADENSTAVTGTQAVFSDPDGDSLTYSLTGDDAALMTVDANGVVGLAAGQDYEALTAAGTNVLAATVVASDGALTESAAVSLTINNVDDTAPVFSATAVSATVDSNESASATVVTVTASDTGTVTYEITAGDPDGVFAINSTSGAITVADADALDAAGAATSYTLTVSAEDGDGNAATTDVSITVDDMTPPEVTAGVTIDIDEDTPVGMVVHTVDASDNVAVTDFAITATAAAFFDIDSSGNVTLTAALDADGSLPTTPTTMTVSATDAASNSGSGTISINVVDVIDEAPVFGSAPTITTMPVYENVTSPIGLTISVNDSDAADTAGNVVYSITGTDAGLFSVDDSTGAVTFLAAPNFESPSDAGSDNTYDFNLIATDTGGLTASTAVAIEINNVDEAPSISDPVAPVTIAEEGTLTLSMPDLMALLGYSDVENSVATAVSITATGAATALGSVIGTATDGTSGLSIDLAASSPAIADYTGSLTLDVKLLDGGTAGAAAVSESNTATITLDVVDTADAPTLEFNGSSTPPGSAVAALPLTSSGLPIGVLTVQDPDAGEDFADDDYSFALAAVSGALPTDLDETGFSVSGGTLMWEGSYTGGTPGTADLTVTVADQFGLTNDIVLDVTFL